MIKRNKILSNIYKLYIFFLPFGKFAFWPFPDFISRYLFTNISTLFLWLGIIYIVISKKQIPITPGIKSFGKLYLFMTVYSLLAAIILFFPLGTLYGETTFRAVIGDIIFYFIVLCSIYFNFYCLSYATKFSELKCTLFVQAIVLLFVGYIQYGLIIGIGGLNVIYNILNSIFALLPRSELNRGVVFFGTEPSAVSLLCILTIPYLLSNLLSENLSIIKKVGVVLLIVAYIPLFMTSDSSSVMIMLIITVLTFVVMLTKRENGYRVLATAGFCVGAAVAIGYGIDRVSSYAVGLDSSTLQYIILGKLFDTSNLSTAMRSSTIVNDMKIFFANPIVGVGSGIQGYFYKDNLPSWAYASSEVQRLLRGESGIVGAGSAFFPAYLSSFGVIGIFVLGITVKSYIKQFRANRQYMGVEKYLFLFFGVLFLSAAWYGLGVKQNQYVALMLSLPLIKYSSYKQPEGEI